MNESPDDNITFNKENFVKIINITKERYNNNNTEQEKVIISNKEKNKMRIYLDNYKQKITEEEIKIPLKEVKKIQIQSLDDNHYEDNSINKSINHFNKISKKSIKNLTNKEGKKENKNVNNNNKIYNIYDDKLNLNPVKVNSMKNDLLKKEKNKFYKENNNKNNWSELSNNIFQNYKNQNYYNKQSDRNSLRSSDLKYNSNLNINYKPNYYNHKNFINIKGENNSNIDKKTHINKNSKELTRNNTLNIGSGNSTNLISSIIHKINSSKSSLSDKTQTYSLNEKCLICERNFSVVNLCCSECNIHFFCRKCLKYYCCELIESGIKRMKCPIPKCNYNIYEDFLKSILSENYFKLLYKNSNIFKSEEMTLGEENISKSKYEIFNKKIRQNSEDKIKNIKLYNKNNVLDINSNIILYNVRKYKKEYCKKCHEPTLYFKTDTVFRKCLNCGFKTCKFCYKEYTNNHLIINNPNHCKVYYRQKENNKIKTNLFCKYIIQVIYVISMYFITFAFCFLVIYKFFKEIIKLNKNEKNIILIILIRIKDFLCLLINVICFLVIFPIVYIWTPFFPIIIALVDGF